MPKTYRPILHRLRGVCYCAPDLAYQNFFVGVARAMGEVSLDPMSLHEVGPGSFPKGSAAVTRQAGVISQAFDLIFAGDEPNRRRSAIVVFEPPAIDQVEGRTLRKAIARVKYLKDQRSQNQQTLQQVLDGYSKASGTRKMRERGPIRSRLAGSGLLPIAAVDVNQKSLNALAKQPNVLAVLPNQPIRLIRPTEIGEGTPEKRELEMECTWGLSTLKIPRLWDLAETRGQGVKVAVLDTGIHGDHEALSGRVEDFIVIDPCGRRITLNGDETFDYERHGTHVCGTIAGGKTRDGIAIGVAPEASLAVAQVHFGQRAFLSTLMDGIVWALEVGADIINMSIGLSYYDEQLDTVFRLLIERGVAPIVAIGNESHGSSSCPGNSTHALGVGAVEKENGKVEVAPFSSGCSLDFPGPKPRRIVKPDLVAPGKGILSSVPPSTADGTGEYRVMDGTSMATPHVSGIMAVLMASKPETEVSELFDVLRESANHQRKHRPDNRWGHGLVDPCAALTLL